MPVRTFVIGKKHSQATKDDSQPKPSNTTVHLHFEGSDDIIASIPQYLLLRFSAAARDKWKDSPPKSASWFALPMLGTWGPSDEAVLTVLDAMRGSGNNHVKNLISLDSVRAKGFFFILEVMVVCLCFRLTPQPHELFSWLHEYVCKSPVTPNELVMLGNLLPLDDDILRAATWSLAYFEIKNQVPEDQARDLDDYIYAREDLWQLYDEQYERQKAILDRNSAGRKGRKGKASVVRRRDRRS